MIWSQKPELTCTLTAQYCSIALTCASAWSHMNACSPSSSFQQMLVSVTAAGERQPQRPWRRAAWCCFSHVAALAGRLSSPLRKFASFWSHDGLPTTHCCSGPISKHKACPISLAKVLATAKTVPHGADYDCDSAIYVVHPHHGVVPAARCMLLSSCWQTERDMSRVIVITEQSHGVNDMGHCGGSRSRQSQTEGNSNETQGRLTGGED